MPDRKKKLLHHLHHLHRLRVKHQRQQHQGWVGHSQARRQKPHQEGAGQQPQPKLDQPLGAGVKMLQMKNAQKLIVKRRHQLHQPKLGNAKERLQKPHQQRAQPQPKRHWQNPLWASRATMQHKLHQSKVEFIKMHHLHRGHR